MKSQRGTAREPLGLTDGREAHMDQLKRIGKMLKRLHRDERGADMVEYILIVLMIALPLLGVAIIFRNEIASMVKSAWGTIRGQSEIPE